MRNARHSAQAARPLNRSQRSVVAVSGDPQRAELLDLLSVDANSYVVIFVESVVRGYSRIKQVTPDLVIVLLEIDDVAACQLLSLLNIDTDTSGIPVVIWAMSRAEHEFE